jgi:hypothetical protein
MAHRSDFGAMRALPPPHFRKQHDRQSEAKRKNKHDVPLTGPNCRARVVRSFCSRFLARLGGHDISGRTINKERGWSGKTRYAPVTLVSSTAGVGRGGSGKNPKHITTRLIDVPNGNGPRPSAITDDDQSE